jgi:hypothetical protein
MEATVRECIERALVAYGALALLGEEVEDEWQYVTDLSAAQADRLADLATHHGDAPASEPTQIAIATAIEEIGLIGDPHRAIDWLSTFPEIVELALAEGAPTAR